MRTRGRFAQVVERIIAATVAELGRVGYEAMRVEDATRSGVNKTTIYRRWATKAELVTAVMLASVERGPTIDTGTVRGDLRASLLGSRSEAGIAPSRSAAPRPSPSATRRARAWGG